MAESSWLTAMGDTALWNGDAATAPVYGDSWQELYGLRQTGHGLIGSLVLLKTENLLETRTDPILWPLDELPQLACSSGLFSVGTVQAWVGNGVGNENI
jgi:hypothetical protein